jgi:hypothetical protein
VRMLCDAEAADRKVEPGNLQKRQSPLTNNSCSQANTEQPRFPSPFIGANIFRFARTRSSLRSSGSRRHSKKILAPPACRARVTASKPVFRLAAVGIEFFHERRPHPRSR